VRKKAGGSIPFFGGLLILPVIFISPWDTTSGSAIIMKLTKGVLDMKIPKAIIGFVIYVIVTSVIAGVLLLLSMPFPGGVTYYGFALDSRGNLYLGSHNKIQVLDAEGQMVKTIAPTTNSRYTFSIVDDHIMIDSGTHITTLDLDGNLLGEKIVMIGQDVPQSFPKKFVDEHGTEYVMKAPWLRTGVYDKTHDMNCIWQMPTTSYICRLYCIVLFASWFVAVLIMVVKLRKILPPVNWS